MVDDFVWPEKLRKTVRKINFSGNQLAVFPKPFAEAESLDLSKNRLDDVPLEDLKTMGKGGRPSSSSSSSSSSSHTHLSPYPHPPTPMKELKLAHNQLTAIPEGIQMLARLEVLDLRNNRISTIPEYLVVEMRTKMRHLRSFSLANNRLPCRPEDAGMYRLWKWLKEDPELFGEPPVVERSFATSTSSSRRLRRRRSTVQNNPESRRKYRATR